MAVSSKATFGPVGFVGEWNGAVSDATFLDDLGTPVRLRPGAWQASLGFQFDWNPAAEAIGSQGTYVAIGYSESYDLYGVTRVIDGEAERVGMVPERRFLLSAGEWVLDGARVAVEYAHNVDYEGRHGGTDRSSDGIVTMLTYEW
jgi:hypothetical protein